MLKGGWVEPRVDGWGLTNADGWVGGASPMLKGGWVGGASPMLKGGWVEPHQC